MPSGKSDWGPFSLSGKVAIVTGGAAGIGLGIVQAFCHAGATCMAVGRREDGEAVIAGSAPGAGFFRADLTDPEAPPRILAEAIRRHGSVDILVNNAAMLGNVPIAALTAARIDAMTAVNIRAVLLMAQALAHHRRQRGPGGKMINIGSYEGIIATLPEGMGAYGATKTAISGLTVSLARELAPLGIGVNGVCPGVVLHENLMTGTDGPSMSAEELAAAVAPLLARTNVGRLGVPEDIANICVFLASRAADYVSGQMIVADGGASRT